QPAGAGTEAPEPARPAAQLRLVPAAGATPPPAPAAPPPRPLASALPPADRPRGDTAVFVGRRTELELLLDEFPVPLAHLVGPPGAGKSAVLAELRRRAKGRVGVGHGAGTPGGLRLTWLRTALTQLAAGPDALAAVDAAIMQQRPLSPEELETLAVALDRPQPVVLAVDDAADLDEVSVAELAWLGRRCPLLSVVLAYRYPSAVTGRPMAALGTPVVLRLGPLAEEDVEELGTPDLGERTGGIPALIGAAHRAPEVATAVAMQIARSRTRFMPEVAWEVLRLSAALGSLRVADLAALTGHPLTEVLDCVDQLIHAHLLTEGPGGHVRHRSGLIRLAIAEQVSSASRMHLNERLAACGE
ncbi:MAG TPA: ATP-binding protein, partial [Actinoplanes sp.]